MTASQVMSLASVANSHSDLQHLYAVQVPQIGYVLPCFRGRSRFDLNVIDLESTGSGRFVVEDSSHDIYRISVVIG